MAAAADIKPVLFPILPPELEGEILSFCDGQTVSQMLRVCRTWNNYSKVRTALEDRLIERDYPPRLIAILRQRGLRLRQIPGLTPKDIFRRTTERNLREEGFFEGLLRRAIADRPTFVVGGERVLEEEDYADFLSTRLLRAPITRFKDQGRPGLVLCLQDRATNEIGICTIFLRLQPSRDPSRRSQEEAFWVHAPIQHDDRALAPPHLSDERGHVVFDALIPILSGTDPTVRLIEPPPAPLPEPLPPVARPVLNTFIDFLRSALSCLTLLFIGFHVALAFLVVCPYYIYVMIRSFLSRVCSFLRS